MSSGEAKASEIAVSEFASRLFGTQIGPDAIIVETLKRATNPPAGNGTANLALSAAVDNSIPAAITDAALREHPLASWVEMEMGLLDGQVLERRPPEHMAHAAAKLAARTGRDEGRCRTQLERMLSVMSLPGQDRGDYRWCRRRTCDLT
jgi:hypothetical protein